MGEAREVGQRWFDTISRGDRSAARALLTDDVDFYSPGSPARTADEIADAMTGYAAAIPNAQFDISAWHEAGDTAIAEGVYRGTNSGPLRTPQGEIPATGREVAVPFVTVLKARDGKLAGHRAYWDNATFMEQLGLGGGPPA
jgi:steroid delta-isomerase-like uncharacterized protein